MAKTYVVRLQRLLIYEVNITSGDEDEAVEGAWHVVEEGVEEPEVVSDKLISVVRYPHDIDPDFYLPWVDELVQ